MVRTSNPLAYIRTLILIAGLLLLLSPAHAVRADGNIENVIEWLEEIAEDQSHGYSQAERWGPSYDCSSLIISACWKAGFELGYDSRTTGYTGDMRSAFEEAGFVWYSASALGLGSGSPEPLMRGDILLTPFDHTEMYLGNGMVIGARGDGRSGRFPTRSTAPGDQGDEISIYPYHDWPWTGVLRYGGSSYPTGEYVFKGSTYLNVRSGPGTGHSVVSRLYPGVPCTVSTVSRGWGRTSIDGEYGWISLAHCRRTSSEEEPLDEPSEAAGYRVDDSIGGLNLRAGRGTDHYVRAVIPGGASLFISSVDDGWGKTSYDGASGYVSMAYVSSTEPSGTASHPADRSTVTVSVDTLNFRTGPGLGHQVMDQLDRGTVLTCLDSSGDWLKVSFRGSTGWVSGNYCS